MTKPGGQIVQITKWKRIKNSGEANNTRWRVTWNGGEANTAGNMQTAHLNIAPGRFAIIVNGRGTITDIRPHH